MTTGPSVCKISGFFVVVVVVTVEIFIRKDPPVFLSFACGCEVSEDHSLRSVCFTEAYFQLSLMSTMAQVLWLV